MTTTELLREAVIATGGDYALAHAYLRAQLPRFACASSAIATLERRKALHPTSARFRVERGGKIVFAASSAEIYHPGDPVPAGIEVITLRARGRAPRHAFRVGSTTHLKYDRALAAAARMTGDRA